MKRFQESPTEPVQRWSLKNLFIMGCVALSFYILYYSYFQSLSEPSSVPAEMYFLNTEGEPIRLIQHLGSDFYIYMGPVDLLTYQQCVQSTSEYTTYLVPTNLPAVPDFLRQLAIQEQSPYCIVGLASGDMLENIRRQLGVTAYPAVIQVGADMSIKGRIEP